MAPTVSPQTSAPMRLTVLGATGSVGTSTLDLVARSGGVVRLEAVTANANADALADIALRHRASFAAVADERAYPRLIERLQGSGIACGAGPSALIEAASRTADCTMAAIMGAAGLAPTLAAVQRGGRIGLANKECLVSAGSLFMRCVDAAGAELIPVDSEHSAVFQALAGHDRGGVTRVTLTASGGPFRTWTPAAIAAATPEQALKHPNWTMGRKITIDSATLMNKGLELIEAHHLFDLAPDRLDVVVHPQSIVHALVAYSDGSSLAQLANPDMRTPIALALSWPRRMATPTPPLDLVTLSTLTFEAPDPVRFPALRLAKTAMAAGTAWTAVLNAANEVAVEAFLGRRLPFHHIAAVVEETMECMDRSGSLGEPGTIEAVLALDAEARDKAAQAIART